MKRFLLLALCAVGLIGTTEASCDFGCREGFYGSLLGGVNFLQVENQKFHVDHSQPFKLKIDTKTGYVIGGAIGYKFNPCFRAELEVAYRSNKLDKVRRSHHHFENELDLHFSGTRASTTTVLANAIYEYDFGCGFVPYVGAGIGYAHNELKVKFKNHFSECDECVECDNCGDNHHKSSRKKSDNGFAWQAIVGTSYQVCEQTDIALEYRFLQAHKDAYNHSICLNLRQYF